MFVGLCVAGTRLARVATKHSPLGRQKKDLIISLSLLIPLEGLGREDDFEEMDC